MALSEAPGANALSELLDRERMLLLSGDLEGLARLAPCKTELIENLPGANAGQLELNRLRSKAEHNRNLLASAAKGIRSATRRLEVLKASARFSTYDQHGTRREMPVAPSTLATRR
jgi:flagellar biosynthesis/type III secretory pathway chaperone